MPALLTTNYRFIGWGVCILITAWVVFVVLGWRNDAYRLKTVEGDLAEYKQDVAAGQVKVEELESELRTQRENNRILMEKWDEESAKNPLYATCAYSDVSVQQINSAAAASRSAK